MLNNRVVFTAATTGDFEVASFTRWQATIYWAMSLYTFETEAIEVTKHRKIERDGKLLVLGEVKNVSDFQAKGVTVNVDLYLNDEFVKQCDETINGGLPSGETRNFEVSCGGGCVTLRDLKSWPFNIHFYGPNSDLMDCLN